MVSEEVLKRHLLRLALEKIWDLAGGDPADYDDDIPEMFVMGLMGRVIECLPGKWASAFDRELLDSGLEMRAGVPREVIQAAIDRAMAYPRRRGEEPS
jgi:hypothetical protein